MSVFVVRTWIRLPRPKLERLLVFFFQIVVEDFWKIFVEIVVKVSEIKRVLKS